MGAPGFLMRAAAALLAAGCLITGCGGGSGPPDPDRGRLTSADEALAERRQDPRLMAAVLRAAYEGASHRYDPGTGNFRPDARPFLLRAAAIWPRYVEATLRRPSGTLAAVMVRIFGDGLRRPRDAA